MTPIFNGSDADKLIDKRKKKYMIRCFILLFYVLTKVTFFQQFMKFDPLNNKGDLPYKSPLSILEIKYLFKY